MKALDQLQEKMAQPIERLEAYLVQLSLRERMMVITAVLVVIVACIGTALWKMHSAAEQQQQRLNQLKDNLVWMQSNVVTMQPASDLNQTAVDKVQRIAQQLGLSVASQQSEQTLQIMVQHENYAVLANLLTQLGQAGLSIEKLELNKVAEQIKLTATVH